MEFGAENLTGLDNLPISCRFFVLYSLFLNLKFFKFDLDG